MHSRSASTLFALLLLPACAGVNSPAGGAATSPDELRAVVRVSIAFGDDLPRQLGSGTIIDAQGDVLTAFHVVGWRAVDALRAGQGEPTFVVELSASSREKPTERYRAHLVEADAALDLALLHIDGGADGKPTAKRFPFLRMATRSRPPELGAGVVAIGFPGSFDTVQAASGAISGLSSNLANHLSWLRTDAQLLPGMSGGALVDRDGVLVGVPLQVFQPDPNVFVPTGLVRPIERVPSTWLGPAHEMTARDLLARFELTADHPIDETLVGDPSPTRLQEQRLVFTPPNVAGLVRVNPEFGVEVADDGHVVRSGVGEVEILADEAPNAWVYVDVPISGTKPVQLHATFEPGGHGRAPLPTTTVHVRVGANSARTPNGRLALVPFSLGAAGEDSAFDYAAGRSTEGDLAAHGIFAKRYDGEAEVIIPECVRGRRYRLVVVPEKGTAYVGDVLVEDEGNQFATANW